MLFANIKAILSSFFADWLFSRPYLIIYSGYSSHRFYSDYRGYSSYRGYSDNGSIASIALPKCYFS